MKKTIKFSILVFVILFASGVSSQDKYQKIDEYMNKCVEYGLFNGTVLVAEHDNVILKKGFGYANLEWNIQNEPDTKFRLGSITKQFTAMLIMQLVEKGLVKLDGHISDYLSYYPKKTGDKITVHQLLSHTSGIFNYTNDPSFFRKDRFLTLNAEELTKKFSDKELDFEPGTKWNYSNSGYIVLGAIVEAVTGKPYEQVLRENIFTPLGMSSTGYDHMETIITKRASGYERGFGTISNTSYLDMSLPFSAGSMYSTVEDLYTWGNSLYTDKLVSFESLKKMMTPVMNNYGYGLAITRQSINGTDSITIVGHSGGINGFNTNMIRMIEDKNTIILLCNMPPLDEYAVTTALTKILYDKPYDMPKKSAASLLYEGTLKSNFNSVMEELKQNKNNYSFSEQDINQLGYNLMGEKKMSEAIEVFKLNAEMYPASWNVYDSIGEAYMNNGDTELAIQNYRKSIELNPKNESGKETLKKLESK